MKHKRAIQKFNTQKIKESKKFSPQEAVAFLEAFKDIAYAGSRHAKGKSKLISIKIPQELLAAFKAKAQTQGKPYQSIIKELMWEWLS